MSKSAPALPCSKSHIRGAVLRYEIAEIRSRLMGTVFDSNKQMCAVTLTHLHAVCRVRDHGGGGVGGRFSGRENERRTHARMACALVDAWSGSNARATRGGALGKCGSCIPGLTYGTGSHGHSRQRGTVAGYGKIDGTGAGRNGASYCGGCGNCHDRWFLLPAATQANL